MPAVLACVADRYYKVCAEALRVCASIARALRPNPPEPSPLALGEYVPPIYEAVSTRLGALDQDQEVKEASIITMGLMIAHVGDALGERLGAALLVLLDRLRNEITRLTAVRAFEAIATSPLNLDLGPTVAQLLTELCSYLRKSSRALRHASLLALHALTTRHARHFSAAHKAEVVRELAPTLSDADMQLAASALALCLSLVEADAKVVGPLVSEHVLPPVLTLLASPLLQSAAIAQMQALLRALVRTNASGLTFETILSQLLGVAGGAEAATGSKQRLSSIALCVAALCEGASDAQRLETVERFKKGIGNGDQQSQLLALHCLGQIGRQMDLSAQRDALLSALTATFDSPAEEVKGAGAFALGCIASGAVRTFLPVLIGQIASAQHAPHHYLLLHALKELILSADDTALQPHVSQILPLLFAQTESAPEDSVKTVVAECLGKLLAAAPAAALPELHARLRHDAAPMRAIAVTALRFAIVDASSGLDTVLPATMGDFFALLSDADLKVRARGTRAGAGVPRASRRVQRATARVGACDPRASALRPRPDVGAGPAGARLGCALAPDPPGLVHARPPRAAQTPARTCRLPLRVWPAPRHLPPRPDALARRNWARARRCAMQRCSHCPASHTTGHHTWSSVCRRFCRSCTRRRPSAPSWCTRSTSAPSSTPSTMASSCARLPTKRWTQSSTRAPSGSSYAPSSRGLPPG